MQAQLRYHYFFFWDTCTLMADLKRVSAVKVGFDPATTLPEDITDNLPSRVMGAALRKEAHRIFEAITSSSLICQELTLEEKEDGTLKIIRLPDGRDNRIVDAMNKMFAVSTISTHLIATL